MFFLLISDIVHFVVKMLIDNFEIPSHAGQMGGAADALTFVVTLLIAACFSLSSSACFCCFSSFFASSFAFFAVSLHRVLTPSSISFQTIQTFYLLVWLHLWPQAWTTRIWAITYWKCPLSVGYLVGTPANASGWQTHLTVSNGSSLSLFLIVAFVIDPMYCVNACRQQRALEPCHSQYLVCI